MTLTSGDYLTIAGLLAAFMTLPGTIIILMLTGLRADNVKFRAEIREALATLDVRITQVEQNKLGREDWIRVTASQTNRLNRVSEQLAELSGQMNAQFGTSGALNRIADVIEKRAEAES